MKRLSFIFIILISLSYQQVEASDPISERLNSLISKIGNGLKDINGRFNPFSFDIDRLVDDEALIPRRGYCKFETEFEEHKNHRGEIIKRIKKINTPIDSIVIHHTASHRSSDEGFGSNERIEELRTAISNAHIRSKRFTDIGYHFLVDGPRLSDQLESHSYDQVSIIKTRNFNIVGAHDNTKTRRRHTQKLSSSERESILSSVSCVNQKKPTVREFTENLRSIGIAFITDKKDHASTQDHDQSLDFHKITLIKAATLICKLKRKIPTLKDIRGHRHDDITHNHYGSDVACPGNLWHQINLLKYFVSSICPSDNWNWDHEKLERDLKETDEI